MTTTPSSTIEQDKKIERMLMRLPFAIDWCSYKGEVVVAQINWDRTVKAGKPMMDISYCMTRALNQNIMYTVQYDKNKFKPCDLSHIEYKNWYNKNGK